jgi:hypothetical protein
MAHKKKAHQKMVHKDEAQDKKLITKMMKKEEMKPCKKK